VQFFVLGNDDYSLGGILTNLFWGMNNILALSGIVMAAFWQPEADEVAEEVAQPQQYNNNEVTV
jgi:cellulose synthase (UDP-forming)